MASVNRVILVGNLGRDPEIKYLPSGEAIANLAIATTDRYKNKSGEMVDATEWHRVNFFGKLAEVCVQYLKKGSQVYVEGSIRTRKWTDKDGIDKYSTEIRGDRMQMLGGKGGSSDEDGQDNKRRQPEPAPSRNPAQNDPDRGAQSASRCTSNGFDDMEDDIPF